MSDTNAELEKQQKEIADLQAQLAFQEDELEKMHTALYSQQQRIDALEIQIKHLMEKYTSLAEASSDAPNIVDEKPPHY